MKHSYVPEEAFLRLSRIPSGVGKSGEKYSIADLTAMFEKEGVQLPERPFGIGDLEFRGYSEGKVRVRFDSGPKWLAVRIHPIPPPDEFLRTETLEDSRSEEKMIFRGQEVESEDTRGMRILSDAVYERKVFRRYKTSEIWLAWSEQKGVRDEEYRNTSDWTEWKLAEVFRRTGRDGEWELVIEY